MSSYVKYVVMFFTVYVFTQYVVQKLDFEDFIKKPQRSIMDYNNIKFITNNTIEIDEDSLIFFSASDNDIARKLYGGWTSPLTRCDSSSYDSQVSITLGGMVPFNKGDTIDCISWKIAASVCIDIPQLFGELFWYCKESGGFVTKDFGYYCKVEDNQYIYKNNNSTDIIMKNCDSVDVSALSDQCHILVEHRTRYI